MHTYNESEQEKGRERKEKNAHGYDCMSFWNCLSNLLKNESWYLKQNIFPNISPPKNVPKYKVGKCGKFFCATKNVPWSNFILEFSADKDAKQPRRIKVNKQLQRDKEMKFSLINFVVLCVSLRDCFVMNNSQLSSFYVYIIYHTGCSRNVGYFTPSTSSFYMNTLS